MVIRKKVKRKANKLFVVGIDMKYSTDYTVKASSAGEAKKKVWNKFKKNLPRNLFNVEVENVITNP